MLLITAAFLTALGLTGWLIGDLFSYHGLAAIGGTIVLAVGGAIVLTDLEVRTGATKTLAYDVVNNSTVATETSVQYAYTAVDIGEIFGVGVLGSLGVGGLIMLFAAGQLMRTYGEVI